MGDEGKLWYQVIADFKPVKNADANQLCLNVGDAVMVHDNTVSEEWWWVETSDGELGYAPMNHLSKVPLTQEDRWDNEEYFGSYSELKLHQEMLNDIPRNMAYKTAISAAAGFMTGKTVLDVGSGSGILSLFCARDGKAKKVYAIERSDMALRSRDIVKANGFSHVIEVIQSDVAEIKLPGKVDMIISEWMGTLLLFEFMIEAVIDARDHHLKEGGVMWPSEAELFLVPCSAATAHSRHVGLWKDVYGFDFTTLGSSDHFASRPIHNYVLPTEDILSDVASILSLDIHSISIGGLERNMSILNFEAKKTGILHGFCSWFEVRFGGIPETQSTYTLSTSPYKPLTHWKQDLLLIKDPILLEVGDVIKGHIKMSRHHIWRRHLQLELSYQVLKGRGGVVHQETTQIYRIWR